MTEDEFRRGTNPAHALARLTALALSLDAEAARLRAAGPRLDGADIYRLVPAARLVVAAAGRIVDALAEPEPSPADLIGDPNHREPGEEP